MVCFFVYYWDFVNPFIVYVCARRGKKCNSVTAACISGLIQAVVLRQGVQTVHLTFSIHFQKLKNGFKIDLPKISLLRRTVVFF